MNSSSCDQLIQILIQTLQDAKKHGNRSFKYCCPLFQTCGAYSFLFWSLPSICFIPQENHYVLWWWTSSSLCRLHRAQSEPGDSRACNGELGRGMSVLLVTLLQQHSCFSWPARPGWTKLVFQDLCSAYFNAWKGSSHLHTVLAWPSAEQEFLNLHLAKGKCPGFKRNAFYSRNVSSGSLLACPLISLSRALGKSNPCNINFLNWCLLDYL